ncbi:uncharacterized protein TNCV_4261461 [Trichonephila clavipes]|nr:uncharacterized protein TNCV_4261461 [Trichonephila clavipes]
MISLTQLFGVLTTRGLLATDHVISNQGQVTWTTPELAPPLLTTTPHQREDVSALDRFNVHRCPTWRVFSGTGLELMTCRPWSDTLTTGLPQPHPIEEEKNHNIHIKSTLYSQGFLASNEEEREKARSQIGFEDFMQSVSKSKTVHQERAQQKFAVKKQSLKYRIQQQYSQYKKAFTSTAFRHNYQCVKYKYVKDYSRALTRPTQQPK